MKKKTVAVLLAVLAVLGIGGYGISRILTDSDEPAADTAVPVISVAELQNEADAAGSRFNGVVETQKKKSITLDSERTVAEVLVAEGDHVNEKDALFTYDTEKTKLEISQKELAKEKLNAEIAGYNDQINQLNAELNKGNLSSADRMSMNAQILENQTSIAQAEYDLKVADSEIASLSAAVKNSTVRAPLAGTIEKIQDPAALTDPSAAFISIVADGDLRVKGSLSEQNIGAVYEGLQMLVRSRIDEEETWLGTVTSLESGQNEEQEDGYSNTNQGADQASKYTFYVTLDSKDGLMLGQHVTMEPYYEKMDGLVLSNGYLTADEEGQTCVYAVKKPGDKLEKRIVETGEEYEEQGMVQILSGLSEDEYVVWPFNEDCREGAATTTNTFAEDMQ